MYCEIWCICLLLETFKYCSLIVDRPTAPFSKYGFKLPPQRITPEIGPEIVVI